MTAKLRAVGRCSFIVAGARPKRQCPKAATNLVSLGVSHGRFRGLIPCCGHHAAAVKRLHERARRKALALAKAAQAQ